MCPYPVCMGAGLVEVRPARSCSTTSSAGSSNNGAQFTILEGYVNSFRTGESVVGVVYVLGQLTWRGTGCRIRCMPAREVPDVGYFDFLVKDLKDAVLL